MRKVPTTTDSESKVALFSITQNATLDFPICNSFQRTRWCTRHRISWKFWYILWTLPVRPVLNVLNLIIHFQCLWVPTPSWKSMVHSLFIYLSSYLHFDVTFIYHRAGGIGTGHAFVRPTFTWRWHLPRGRRHRPGLVFGWVCSMPNIVINILTFCSNDFLSDEDIEQLDVVRDSLGRRRKWHWQNPRPIQTTQDV